MTNLLIVDVYVNNLEKLWTDLFDEYPFISNREYVIRDYLEHVKDVTTPYYVYVSITEKLITFCHMSNIDKYGYKNYYKISFEDYEKTKDFIHIALELGTL